MYDEQIVERAMPLLEAIYKHGEDFSIRDKIRQLLIDVYGVEEFEEIEYFVTNQTNN